MIFYFIFVQMVITNEFLGYLQNNNISILKKYLFFFFLFFSFFSLRFLKEEMSLLVFTNSLPHQASMEVFLMRIFIYFSYMRLPPLEVFTHRSVLDASKRFSSRYFILFFSLFHILLFGWIESISSINHIHICFLHYCCKLFPCHWFIVKFYPESIY
jgi:hypothetical protein